MARRKQLVCQHLENIARKALEEYQDIVPEYVKGRQGVYALYRRNKLYYVGLASNLRRRLAQHLRDRHGQSWDRFSVYLTIGDRHLKELESLVLRIVKPAGNKQAGKFVKSESLNRRFARDIRECQRRELASIMGRRTVARTPRKKRTKARREPEGRKPVLARYVTTSVILKARFKGQTIRARVRKDGMIRFDGSLYNSPSKAAAIACRRRTCNGWRFWTFERAPGDWVPLDRLRRR